MSDNLTNQLRKLIDRYVEHVQEGDYSAVVDLYRLPMVLKGADGEYSCIINKEQLKNHIAHKIVNFGKSISMEYSSTLGSHFYLLKESSKDKTGFNKDTHNGLIITMDGDNAWIIGECLID
jgi:hypothetical protein